MLLRFIKRGSKIYRSARHSEGGGGDGFLQREKGNGQKLLRIKSDDNNFQERKNDGVTTLSEKNMYDPFDKSL